jgi:putative addiction module killer protein
VGIAGFFADKTTPLDKMQSIVYTIHVKEIRETDRYKKWYQKLNDIQARARIKTRIRRLSLGNPGDCQPIGNGLSEMRIHYGPGYRVYYKDTGREIIILLCGGDKATQQADIENAKKLANEKEEKENENENN